MMPTQTLTAYQTALNAELSARGMEDSWKNRKTLVHEVLNTPYDALRSTHMKTMWDVICGGNNKAASERLLKAAPDGL